MIISASYKTDIPTFYGDWLINRLVAGYCKTLNPHNNTISRVELTPESVEGIVLWTKNLGPFLNRLADVRAMGYPFVIQYTINGYPRFLESRVIDAARSVEHLTRVAGEFGPRVGVWRYDTIILTTKTPLDWHVENFSKLAKDLEGVVDEVVVSFVHFYQKTRRNLSKAANRQGVEVIEISAEEKQKLLIALVSIAQARGMLLSVCSQPDLLVPGAAEARCVDARRLEAVSMKPIFARVRGNRAECGCYESRDIGEYDTCPHGCVYCYAVRNDTVAKARHSAHDPRSEFLFAPPATARESTSRRDEAQLPIFALPTKKLS